MSAVAVLLLLLAGVPLAVVGLSDPGVLYLDELTFDKVVDGTKDVLVRFDKEYPWGDAHDAFKAAAKDISASTAPLLVAGVPISNSKDYPVNAVLSSRFGLSGKEDNDWPVFKLFKVGQEASKAVTYPLGEAVTTPNLIKWVVKETGAFIAAKGQIRELHELAKEFMSAAAGSRAELVEKGKDLANRVAKEYAGAKVYVEYYVKTMSRILEKGDGYVKSEEQRLQRVIANDKSITADKKDTFEWRLNILASFQQSTEDAKQEL